VSEALWVADAISHDIEVLHVGQSRIALPPGTGASSMAFYRGDLLSSFQGDLLVGASNARALLRLRFDRRDPTRIVGSERLFEEFAGAIATVAVGPEGAIYFGSDLGLFRIRTH
jgi:glucose/arabinose dehydrogenase